LENTSLKMNIQSAIAAMLIAIFITACSSGSSLSFQSNPGGAEVWIAPMDGTNAKRLGQTPLLIQSDEAQKKAGASGPIIIEFRKDGYLSNKTMITDLYSSEISLTAQLTRSSGLENIESLNLEVDRLFEAQRLVRASRLDDALKLIEAVQKDAPELSAVYEIEGGIYYLQKKPQESLDSYQTSIRFNPKNMEAIRMRNYLSSKLGVTTSSPPPLNNVETAAPATAPAATTSATTPPPVAPTETKPEDKQ